MKRAALLLSISISLCSGCAARPAPPPVLLPVAPCPAPIAPPLPSVNGETLLDSPVNVAALLERESRLRLYLAGLRATLACYEAQQEKPQGAAHGME